MARPVDRSGENFCEEAERASRNPKRDEPFSVRCPHAARPAPLAAADVEFSRALAGAVAAGGGGGGGGGPPMMGPGGEKKKKEEDRNFWSNERGIQYDCMANPLWPFLKFQNLWPAETACSFCGMISLDVGSRPTAVQFVDC